MDTIAHETGIKERDLLEAHLPKLQPKVVYIDGWVYIPNWPKYHLSESGTMSPQQQKGMETAWSQVPERIRLKIRDLTKKDIPYLYPMGGVSPSTITSTVTTPYSEVEKSTSQEVSSLSEEVTSAEIDSFGNPITPKPKKTPKIKVSDGRVEQIIEIWNRYPTASSIGKGKVPNKTAETELLSHATKNFPLEKKIKDRLRFFPDISQWEKAIKKYIEDVVNRQPDNSYAIHRFSLFDFVNQNNGFPKFVNK
jgi:hypothetical protein